jgi:hypothetical protein
MTAPIARAKTAVREVRDLGELDIKVLEMGGVPVGGASTGESSGAFDRPRAEPRPFYPSEHVARAATDLIASCPR